MKIYFTFVGLLAASTVSADFNQVAKDGVAIINDLNNVRAKLQAFTGPPGQIGPALAVQNATKQLNSDLGTAAADIRSTDSFTADQAIFLAQAVASLQTTIYETLDLLNSKKPAFQSVAGFLPVAFLVKDQLVSLKDNINGFGDALVPKLTPELRRVAPLLTSDINFHLIRSIQLYS